MSVQLLKEMFDRMVVRKDIELLPVYYHPDFTLTTNGQQQDYDTFAAGHAKVYPTPITYSVSYDEQAWVEAPDRVAGRMWITTQLPGEDPTTMEIILIATYLDGRLHRVCELTWPDWSQLAAFEDYN